MKKRQWNPITYRCADYIRLTAMIYHRKAMDDMHGYAVMIYRSKERMIYHRKAMDDMHGYAVMIYRRGAAD